MKILILKNGVRIKLEKLKLIDWWNLSFIKGLPQEYINYLEDETPE
jgi:hypothetical protein